MTLKVRILRFLTFTSKTTVVLQPYLLTTKLSCLLKNNFGHTNEGVDDYDYDEFDDEKDTPDDDLTAPSDTGAFSRVFKLRLIYS